MSPLPSRRCQVKLSSVGRPAMLGLRSLPRIIARLIVADKRAVGVRRQNDAAEVVDVRIVQPPVDRRMSMRWLLKL